MALTLGLSTFTRLGKGVYTTSQRFLLLGSTKYGTVVPFKLSDIGEGIREVTLKEWFVSPGDKVAQFDQICEVQSDKASVTITSRYDGQIKALHYKVDDTALVGNPLVDIELEDEAPGVTSDNEIRREAGETLAVTTKPNETLNKKDKSPIPTTPAVRRIASENKIDLRDVIPTGKAGRILKEDMLAYLEKKSNMSVDVKINKVAEADKIETLKGYEKHMWKTMTRSLSIPHFVYSDECDLTKLVRYRNEVKNFAKEFEGVDLTFLPFFVKAISRALNEFPRLNAWVDENTETLKIFENHNISLAMDTPEGLVVPNIKNVQNLSIIEIAKELNRLQQLGKKAAVPLNDLTGGTFSFSNIGVVGGTYTKPVILPPQIVIGAVGKIQKLPRFDASQNVVAADILTVSWAADHRVVDGVTMAKFSNRWKYFVENPSYLILLP